MTVTTGTNDPVVQPHSASPIFGSVADIVTGARALRTTISGNAGPADSGRMVPPATVDAFVRSGLIAVNTPRRWGGSELGVEALVATAMAIGRECGSSAWLFGVFAGHCWLAALFPEQAQRELFVTPQPLISSVTRLSGTARVVEGGYYIEEGNGAFSSGIDHARWVMAGNPVMDVTGASTRFFLLLERCDVEVVDDWFVSGMRGTGSRSVRVRNVFVPRHRALDLGKMDAGTTDGARLHRAHLYRLPGFVANALALAGPVLGSAQGAIDDLSDIFRQRANRTGGSLSDLSCARLAEASARLAAAQALVLTHCRSLDHSIEGMTRADWLRIRRDTAFAAQEARQCANIAFESAGAHGIYDSNNLQRKWRDTNAGAAHFALSWEDAALNCTRAQFAS